MSRLPEGLTQEMINKLILKELAEIKSQMQNRLANLLVKDAIDLYWQHLMTKKKPRGYRYVLDVFLEEFAGRNIAEITAEEMEGVMLRYWSNGSSNSIRTRHTQLTGLFNYSIKVLLKKGCPTFSNPMNLISKPYPEIKDHEFLPVEKMREVMHSPNLEHHGLVMAMLATTGMRCAELLKLRVEDKDGQVLTLRSPKSGNDKEWVVVPVSVEQRLARYINASRLRAEDPICPVSYSTIYDDIVIRHSTKYGVPFTPHYFRKWISTFWDRQGEENMVRTVLRHRSSQAGEKLRKIYVAPLSIDEVKEKQQILDTLIC